MRTWSGLHRHKTGPGFTLVEVILVVALLSLLLGASIFSFASLQRGARLDEGAGQLETLFRFAKAYAANSGKLTQITFKDDFILSSNAMPIEVTCETDPLNRPGVFEPVLEALPYLERLTDLIRVTSSEVSGKEAGFAPIVETNYINSVVFDEDEFDLPEPLSPISFYPDGSCDSAELILMSRDDEDHRRMRLRLAGLLGTVRRGWITDTNAISGAEEAMDPDMGEEIE